MNILYLDLETTGLDWNNDQVLEIGMVWGNKHFHCYVDHPRITGNPTALAMNAAIIARIAKKEPGYRYFQPQYLAEEIVEFFRRNDLPDHINAGGKNIACFDYNFLAALPGIARNGGGVVIGGYELRARTVDPAVFYALPEDTSLPNLDTCLRRAGIDKTTNHTAIDDCLLVKALVERNGL